MTMLVLVDLVINSHLWVCGLCEEVLWKIVG